MTAVSIILGVLMVLCGFSCMFTPLATFLSTGIFLCSLLLVYGIFGIVRFFRKEAGVPEFVVSILAVIFGVICVIHPGETLTFDKLVLTLIAVWLIVEGIVSVLVAFGLRGDREGWFWGVIVGVLGILAGIYSFAHPILTAVTEGVLIGIYFVQAGFDMIVLGCGLNAARKEIEAAANQEDDWS